jgi:adenylate cyclase
VERSDGTGFRLQLAATAAVVVVIVWLLSGTVFWQTLENRTLDLRFSVFPTVEDADGGIILVEIDAGSLERMSWLSWPWPRQIYSACLSYLQELGVRVVAFDILFDLPSVYAATEDTEFGETAAGGETVFVMGLLQRRDGYPVPANAVVPAAGETAFLDSAWSCTRPWESIAAGATLLGSTSDRQDPDGIFRSVRLLTCTPAGTAPSLPLAVAWLAMGRPPISISRDRLTLGGVSTRLDGNGRLQLRFHGPAGSYRALPMAELLASLEASETGGEQPIDTAMFRGAIVLFGYADPALYDLKPTPYSPMCPGVEVLATAIDNIMHGESVRRTAPWLTVALAAAVSLLVAACLGFVRSVLLAGLSGSAVMAAYAGAAVLAFGGGLWMDALVPLASGGLTLLAGGIIAYGHANRQRRLLRAAFSQYISPVLMKELLKHPELLRLGGEKKQMTAFFSDVQGFTSISESLDPESLVNLINIYLTRMTDVVMSNLGTVDKFEGDAIIAFWNAPVDVPDHAGRACETAWRCRELHGEMNRELREMGFPELRTRIGLNTGEMVVGNMGSGDRFDYTIMGEAVNLASRLEGTNKVYGTSVMTTSGTVGSCGDSFVFRELDTVRVVGQKRPVTLYELVCRTEDLDGETRGRLEAYAAALSLYREGRFGEAAAGFGAVGDAPSNAMAARCREFLASPPPGGEGSWDGVYALSSK